MNTDTFVGLLKNSGFHNVRHESGFVSMEDPSCVLRGFETFADYAWIVIVCLTALLLVGWGISMVRGAKNDIFTNMRNLVLIFGILAATKPIVDFIYGDDLFARGCDTITIPIDQVNQMMDARNAKLSTTGDLYEEIDIFDSGPNDTDEELDKILEPETNPASEPDLEPVSAPQPEPEPDTDGAPMGARPVSANASGNDVIYTAPDGNTVRRSNGTRAWRNNNPGNIVYGNFARSAGAIGYAGKPSPTGNVYFAVFPDKETGTNAIRLLLRTNDYQQKTVAQAIYKWCPDSTSPMYKSMVNKMTGIDLNMPMSRLTDAQLESVVRAIMAVEGWREGTEQRA